MADRPATDTEPEREPALELEAEQDYLIHARAEMARMREHTLGLEAQAGDAIAGEHLAELLWRRAQSLRDDPATTLFFGRTDTAAERRYIGRRHVSDAEGDPVVVDWRADVATPFYRATRTEPMGVRLRRRFGVDRGQLTAYEDEHLTDPREGEADGHGASRILAHEIERPRSGPMRDIVATIQPEQDEIVRAELGTTICVQGAPGTGKTAVGLHRAAWLLYSFRERLRRTGVLVIGPNRAFLEHVGAVLPALGEVEVRHTTVEELVGAPRGQEPVALAVLKGDARMAQVLHRAVWSRVGRAQEALVVPRGARRWRIPEYDVQDIVDELTSRGVRYEAARAMLPRRLAHAVLVRMERSGDTPDDRVQDAVARSRPVTSYAGGLWPTLEATAVLHRLWSDAEALAEAADGILSAQEQRALLWEKPPRSKGAARWTPADLVLLDELTDVLERTTSLGHLILDEAQDLSPMQLRAVGRRASTGSLTVLGDLAQGTTPWSTRSWDESLTHLGKPDAHLEELTRGFRVPAAVIEYAATLLPHIAPGLGLPESVRTNRGRLEVRRARRSDGAGAGAADAGATDDAGTLDEVAVDARTLDEVAIDAVHRALELPGTVGVIVADTQVPALVEQLTSAGLEHDVLGAAGREPEEDHRIQLVAATLAKGLEFDQVVVVEPADIVASEPDTRTGLRRLYVVLTRAVSGLTVVHDAPLPAELGALPA